MADLGVRVIRVYTLLDPSFYRELRRWNLAHPDSPLYVIHGVWIPEDRFLEAENLWDPRSSPRWTTSSTRCTPPSAATCSAGRGRAWRRAAGRPTSRAG